LTYLFWIPIERSAGMNPTLISEKTIMPMQLIFPQEVAAAYPKEAIPIRHLSVRPVTPHMPAHRLLVDLRVTDQAINSP
jgi:hypothetical protein